MDKRQMVTIETLERSQPTRPRHWIPVYCGIFFVLCFLVGGVFTVCSLNLGSFSDAIYGMLPNFEMTVGGTMVFGKAQVWLILFLPASLVVLNLFAIIGACRMAHFRHVYWWYAAFALIAYIAMAIFTIFWILFTFVPFINDSLSRMLAPEMISMLTLVFVYGNIGYTAMLVIAMFFGLFYCINYPAKYERIYTLRKRRLKSLRSLDDKIAYKKRFYRDYKKGKWISMLLDLHADALKEGKVERMDEDAYEFLVYYSCLCDSTVKKAIFDEYARQGRYYECRSIFNEIKTRADAVSSGAKIRVPTYAPAEPRVERRPKPEAKPAPVVPKRRHYRPDEI